MMAVILIFKAHEARKKNYRKTEMWLYLPKEVRAARSLCPMGQLNGAAGDLSHLREWTAAIAAAMWMLALVFSAFGK